MNLEYPYLEVTQPEGTEYKIELEKIIACQNSPEIKIGIGRQDNNDIVLSDPDKKISRHHCSLQYRDSKWWIVDKGSANGTFLQRDKNKAEIDVRTEKAITLRSGDCILILGKLSSVGQPIFWQLVFIDPGETSQFPSLQAIYSIEYSLTQQTLFRHISHRRDSVSLGEQELALIDYMSRKNHQNRERSIICEYDELIEAVWRNDGFGRDKRHINHLVWRIREKIELDSGNPKFLKTLKGRGYTLNIKVTE